MRLSAAAVTILTWTAISLFAPCGCKKKPTPYPDRSTPQAAAVTFAKAMETDDLAVAQE